MAQIPQVSLRKNYKYNLKIFLNVDSFTNAGFGVDYFIVLVSLKVNKLTRKDFWLIAFSKVGLLSSALTRDSP